MDHEPLKVPPDFVYVHLCAKKPTRRPLNFEGVFSEIVADRLPYQKSMYLVAAWQRGIGRFEFKVVVRSEDGKVLIDDEPYKIEMWPQGTHQESIPINFEVGQYGTYLVEGFLDGEMTFRTMLKVAQVPTPVPL